MARFDVHPMPGNGDGYLLDVQADLLDRLNTRTVVPLFRATLILRPMRTLNPIFTIKGGGYVMITQSVATILTKELEAPILSLSDHQATIMAALDFLFAGI